MKRLLFCLGCFCFLLLIFQAADADSVIAEGVANIGNDPAAARDKAIEDALRRAVDQAVGAIVESETLTENYQLISDRIYSHSSGYVQTYNVLSENREGNLLRVRVSAEVKSADLQNDLAGIGLLQRRMKYPRVMVMIAENNIVASDFYQVYSVSNSQSEAAVNAKLKAKGFNVVDSGSIRRTMSAGEAKAAFGGDYDTAGRVGSKLGAEIVIIGQAASIRAANNIAGSDLLSMSSTINAKAVKAGTGEIIAQASGQGTAAHINEVAALQQSLAKASDQIGDQLIAGILESWKQDTSGSRSLVLELQDISPAELEKVKSALLKLRGVTDVQVRSFSGGLADVNIQAKTDAQDLADSITKTKFSGFRLVLIESSMDRLEYRVVH